MRCAFTAWYGALYGLRGLQAKTYHLYFTACYRIRTDQPKALAFEANVSTNFTKQANKQAPLAIMINSNLEHLFSIRTRNPP